MLGRRTLIRWVLPSIPGLIILSVWQWGSGSIVDPLFFSTPSDILIRLFELLGDGKFWTHVQVTVWETVLGFAIGSLSAIVMAYLAGSSPWVNYIIEPYLVAINAVPKVALAPLFILWFGIGIWSKVATATMMVFFLVFYSVYMGVRSTDKALMELARVMGCSQRQVTMMVLLPATMPFVMTGLRTATPYAVIAVIIAEFAASTKGIGYMILYAANLFDTPTLFAGILVLLVFVLIITNLISRAERALVRWQPQKNESKA